MAMADLWQTDLAGLPANAIAMRVDTSHCGLETVPSYFTSLGGLSNHHFTVRITSILDASGEQACPATIVETIW